MSVEEFIEKWFTSQIMPSKRREGHEQNIYFSESAQWKEQFTADLHALLAAREAETREQCARMVESKRNEALKRGLDAEWTEPYAELETAIRAHTPTGPGP